MLENATAPMKAGRGAPQLSDNEVVDLRAIPSRTRRKLRVLDAERASVAVELLDPVHELLALRLVAEVCDFRWDAAQLETAGEAPERSVVNLGADLHLLGCVGWHADR